MTKKDYIAIAAILKQARYKWDDGTATRDMVCNSIAVELADVMARDNPRFDRACFLAACKP